MSSGRGNNLQLLLEWKSNVAEKRSFSPVDRTVLMITYLLLLIGLIMMFSASGVMAEIRYGDSMFFLKRQAVWIVLGLLVLHWVSRQDYGIWKPVMPLMLGLTVVILALVLIPMVGSEVNGARRWFRFGWLSFQPGELAKLTAVLYLSSFLVRREKDITNFTKGVLAPVIVVGTLALLAFLEPDMGTAVVMFSILLGLLFLGGARISHLSSLVLSLLPLAYLLIMKSDYRRRRLMSFLDPWEDPNNTGFQLSQSFVALGNGGLAGVGLGEGRQKLFFLPEAHADFVLALVGEELGFLGTGLLMVLFAILLVKGFRIAGRAPDAFGRHLASGVTLLIGIQVLINAGVVSGLLPTKGLTLPLVSYGGSSLLVSLIAIGILLSISREDSASRVV